MVSIVYAAEDINTVGGTTFASNVFDGIATNKRLAPCT